MAITLEERQKLAEDWKNRKVQKEEVTLDAEDKDIKGETPVLPEDNDIMYTPNPEYEDNTQYKNRIETIKNTANGMEMTCAIVSESEADLAAKKISASSPIGKGLLGKKVGDIADIEVPNGIMQFEIIEITRL